MANENILNLPVATSLTGAEWVPVVQAQAVPSSNVTKRAQIAQIAGGSLTIGTTTITSGTTTRLLYDNAGVLGETAGMTWDGINQALTIGGVTATTSNPVLNLTQTWNAGGATFIGKQTTITDTASAAGSLLERWNVGSVGVAAIDKIGAIVWGTAGPAIMGSIGLDVTGSSMKIRQNNADMLNIGWINNDPSGGAVNIQGVGADRLQIQSDSALVHIAANGEFEWESPGSNTISFVGFISASANGKPITFTNFSQDVGNRADVVYCQTYDTTKNPLSIFYQTNAVSHVDYTGTWYGKSFVGVGGASGSFNGVFVQSSHVDIYTNNGDLTNSFLTGGLQTASTGYVAWSATSDPTGSADLFLYRDAANTLAFRNGTSVQTVNVYATYASSTDYHRVAIAAAKTTLASVSGASVTATNLIPDGAVLIGVTTKVTIAIGGTGGTTGYTVGDGSDADRWGVASTITAGTSTDNRDWTATTIQAFTSANNVVITAAGGNFDGTGSIEVSVQYLIGQCD